MPTIAELLPKLPDDNLVLLAGPSSGDIVVHSLTAVDSLDEVRQCAPGSLIIVPRHCTELLTGFELDTLVRYAADIGIAGFVFHQLARVPVTVEMLAAQAGLTIFGFLGTETMVELVHRLDSLLGNGNASALTRALAVVTAVRRAPHTDYREVLRQAGLVLGSSLMVGWLSERPVGAENIIVGGADCGWVSSSHVSDTAVALVLPYLASVIGQCYERSLYPIESAGDLISGIVASAKGASEPAVSHARARKLPIDSLHVVACLRTKFDESDGMNAPPELTRQRRAVATIAADTIAVNSGRTWLVVRIGDSLGLVWLGAEIKDSLITHEIEEDLEFVIAALNSAVDGAEFFCGVGAPGSGVAGLIAAAAQAQATSRQALVQRASGQVMRTTVSHLDNLLIQSIASPLAMSAVRTILAPLDDLSDTARFTAIQTLSTYLDNQGSNTKAAEHLHLHPNAVAYRIKRTFAMFPDAVGNPDARVALHLACRLWLIDHKDSAAELEAS